MLRVLSLLSLLSLLLTGCLMPTDLHKRGTVSGSGASSAAAGTEMDQELEVLYCLGFCAMAEVGSEAETETIQRVLKKVEEVAKVEEKQAEQVEEAVEAIEDIDRRVKKVRALDKELYEDNPELKEVVE